MQTQEQIVSAARELIASYGYNGFSYGDIAKRVGVRNASIHHYFPAKSDLAVAVIRQSRDGLEAQSQVFAKEGTHPLEQIVAYADYWKQCIADGTASFCVAGMLASELPSLPQVLADEVKGHFAMLIDWFARLFAEGRARGDLVFVGDPRTEAEQFVATIYGAMLSARAMQEPSLFAAIADQAIAKLRGV